MSASTYQSFQSLGLSEQRLLSILPHVTTEFLVEGAMLRDHAPSESDLFYVVSGMVCTQVGEGAGAIPLEIYGPGSWLCSAVPKICASGHFQSLTGLQLLCLPARLAEEAFNHDLNFVRYMAKLSMWRAQLASEMLALTKAGNSAARVVIGLALLGHSLSSGSSHLPGVALGDSLRIPLKQQPLADYLGLSRRIVSSTFGTLSDGGWLQLGYGSLDLLKPAVWAALYRSRLKEGLHFFDKPMPDLLAFMHELESAPTARLAVHRSAAAWPH